MAGRVQISIVKRKNIYRVVLYSVKECGTSLGERSVYHTVHGLARILGTVHGHQDTHYPTVGRLKGSDIFRGLWLHSVIVLFHFVNFERILLQFWRNMNIEELIFFGRAVPVFNKYVALFCISVLV